jgi:hypothetical protein
MLQVTKASGEKEAYQEEKVLQSIKRAGIPHHLQREVLKHIEKKLYDGIPTYEIYRTITNFLASSENPFTKGRYSLKQAIMDLGPTGYPFEDFISKVLISAGYMTKVRQVLLGKCITHEIDVVAAKSGKTSIIEAKFHNNPGTRTEVHTALYTKARFDDVSEKYGFDMAWIVTNTKATVDAITYAECVGMKVLSWSYPENESLRDLIETKGLHPVTILTTLSRGQKEKLLQNHIVTCKDIEQNNYLLDMIHLPPQKKSLVLSEIAYMCNSHPSDPPSYQTM